MGPTLLRVLPPLFVYPVATFVDESGYMEGISMQGG